MACRVGRSILLNSEAKRVCDCTNNSIGGCSSLACHETTEVAVEILDPRVMKHSQRNGGLADTARAEDGDARGRLLHDQIDSGRYLRFATVEDGIGSPQSPYKPVVKRQYSIS